MTPSPYEPDETTPRYGLPIGDDYDTATIERPTEAASYPPGGEEGVPAAPAVPEPRGNRRFAWVIGVLIVVVLILVGVIVALATGALGPGTKETQTPTPTAPPSISLDQTSTPATPDDSEPTRRRPRYTRRTTPAPAPAPTRATTTAPTDQPAPAPAPTRATTPKRPHTVTPTPERNNDNKGGATQKGPNTKPQSNHHSDQANGSKQ